MENRWKWEQRNKHRKKELQCEENLFEHNEGGRGNIDHGVKAKVMKSFG